MYQILVWEIIIVLKSLSDCCTSYESLVMFLPLGALVFGALVLRSVLGG